MKRAFVKRFSNFTATWWKLDKKELSILAYVRITPQWCCALSLCLSTDSGTISRLPKVHSFLKEIRHRGKTRQMLCQRTSLSVQAEANTRRAPLWKGKQLIIIVFHSCLLSSQNWGPACLWCSFSIREIQTARCSKRGWTAVFLGYRTGAIFQSSNYCKTRCSGFFHTSPVFMCDI